MSPKTNAIAAAVAAAGLAVGLGACGTHTLVVRAAAQPVASESVPAPVVTHTEIIVQNKTAVARAAPAPAYPPQSGYVTDTLATGIVAPGSWIQSTGETLCSDWAAGESTADTDYLLQASGRYVYRDAIFNEINEADVCS